MVQVHVVQLVLFHQVLTGASLCVAAAGSSQTGSYAPSRGSGRPAETHRLASPDGTPRSWPHRAAPL